jgi:hypothetical protein
MSIVAVERMWSRDSSNLSSLGNGRLKMTVQEGYQVVHSVDATQIEIQSAAGLPTVDSIYPGTSFVYTNSLAPQRVSPIMSVVIANYEGETDEGPELPEISYTDTSTTASIDEDWNGAPIVTTAGESIAGVTTEISDPVMRVRRKYRSFSQYATAAYRRATNSDIFNGWPPGTARLTQFDAKYVGNLTDGYWDVTATITFRFPYRTTPDKAWYARVLNQGYEYLDGGRRKRATEEDGAPVTSPVLLKQDGSIERYAASAYWLEFQLYDSLPYNALGLLA